MENKELLSEERYQKNVKKIKIVALVILVVGLLIGGILIALGIKNISNVNSEYSNENKASLTEQIATTESNLKARKTELEAKGIAYDSFAKYTDGESYEMKIIVNALDPSFDYCKFDEYKNNTTTTQYCSLKEQQDVSSDNFGKIIKSGSSIPLFMFGAFVIISSGMIAGSVYMFAKRREITAFTTQQVMPVAQEGIEKMAPTIGSAAGTIGKEIAKGIKEGLKDEEK